MEAVAPRDEVAGQRHRRAVVSKVDTRRCTVDVVQVHVADLEQDRGAALEPQSNEILDQFLLTVDGDASTAGELAEVDVMVAATETQLNAVMDKPFTPQTFAGAGALEEINAALLQDSRAHAVFDILARARLQDNRADALQAQQMREHQPGRPSSDDADLGR